MSTRQARLRLRAAVLQSVRSFFAEHGYLEIETPVRVNPPALEAHIDAIPSGDAWLRTSPELHMKRLLAEGFERIFQVGPCFRAGERGRVHRPEYTMLEWYRAGAGYLEILEETTALVRRVAVDTLGGMEFTARGCTVDVGRPWDRVTVSDAFLHTAGWDPVAAYDAERFNRDLVEKVEPALDPACATVLCDYPVEAAALARCRPGPPAVAERWELYIGGFELANAFGELTDAAEQRRRFEACATGRRRAGQEVYPLDEAFLSALEQGMPNAAGVALGVDRLVMMLADAETIDDVCAFPAR